MKKVGFLLCVIAITASSLLTSCFSSSGSLDEPNIPRYGSNTGRVVSTTSTTDVPMISNVSNLSGVAVVTADAAKALQAHGWWGILVILNEPKTYSSNVTKLENPASIKEHEFRAKTVCAYSAPPGVKFDGCEVKFDMYSKDSKVDGTDMYCVFSNSTDTVDVDINGGHIVSRVGYFGENWDYYLHGFVKNIRKSVEKSDIRESYVKTGDNIVSYNAAYGYKTEEKNPFVISYVKQLLGSSQSINDTFYYYNRTGKDGYALYYVEQDVVTFDVVSGSQTFAFKAYGTPRAVYTGFRTIDHDGGAGN